MTQNSNEPRESLAPGVRESASGASNNVPHGTGRTRRGRWQSLHSKLRAARRSVLHDWWQQAETAWAMSDFPEYRSPEWEALPEDDPRKLAAMLSAAARWSRAMGGGSPWASD